MPWCKASVTVPQIGEAGALLHLLFRCGYQVRYFICRVTIIIWFIAQHSVLSLAIILNFSTSH